MSLAAVSRRRRTRSNGSDISEESTYITKLTKEKTTIKIQKGENLRRVMAISKEAYEENPLDLPLA